MMNLFNLKKLVLIVLLSISVQIFAQDTKKDSCKTNIKLNVGADIMSRYIWRGNDYGNSPSVQPTFSLGIGNFELGSWSAIATNSFYKEVDLYAKYTLKNFSFLLSDYYVPLTNGFSSSPDIRYFIYDEKTTAHAIEGSITYKCNENFPLWIMGGTYFYGNDKRWGFDVAKDTAEQTYYSTYLEAGYNFKIKEQSADVFVGFTPFAGAYGSEMGVVNCGFTGYKSIKFNEDFSLPVKGSLIFNPQTSNIFFAFGITL